MSRLEVQKHLGVPDRILTFPSCRPSIETWAYGASDHLIPSLFLVQFGPRGTVWLQSSCKGIADETDHFSSQAFNSLLDNLSRLPEFDPATYNPADLIMVGNRLCSELSDNLKSALSEYIRIVPMGCAIPNHLSSLLLIHRAVFSADASPELAWHAPMGLEPPRPAETGLAPHFPLFFLSDVPFLASGFRMTFGARESQAKEFESLYRWGVLRSRSFFPYMQPSAIAQALMTRHAVGPFAHLETTQRNEVRVNLLNQLRRMIGGDAANALAIKTELSSYDHPSQRAEIRQFREYLRSTVFVWSCSANRYLPIQ